MTPKMVMLKLIAKNDGELGWHQIAHKFAQYGLQDVNVGDILKQLAAEDLIRPNGDPFFAKTHYNITDAGQAVLTGTTVPPDVSKGD